MGLLKRVILVSTLLLLYGATVGLVSGQKVTFESSAPSLVATGKAFRVEFSLNQRPSDFEAPLFEGFDVLAGPTVSTGKDIVIQGGNMVQMEQYVYTYVLMASEAGIFSIPTAKATVDGKSYSTKSLPIEVTDEGEATGVAGQERERGDAQQSATQNNSIAADGIILRAIVDKTTVYKGQPVKVSFKLYTRVPIAGTESAKMPAFNGFWSQQLETNHYKVQRETYNSKIYESNVILEYLLYPQQSGVLTIEQLEVVYIANMVIERERSQSQSIFDDFFNSGPDIQQVSRRVVTKPIAIRVNDWPSGAPAGFNGAVGNFTMTSDFSATGATSDAMGGAITLAANSSATYTIKVMGTGNLPLIQAPQMELPTSFEQYNIKTTESLNKNVSGISGYRQFEYPIIARSEGTYSIEPIKFSYFNPQTAKYVTLASNEKELVVVADSTGGGSTAGALVSGLSKEEIKILGQDIRFIKLGSSRLSAKGSTFMGSWSYYAIFAALVVAFVGALLYIQRRIKDLGNTNLLRGKRANKVALQRLKAAEGYLAKENHRGFYEEMLKALWGYMSDKLNIPAGILTKDNVREELTKHAVPVEQITKYVDLISDCEYAQYSPDSSGHMQDVYGRGVAAISRFESMIKSRM